MGCMSFAACTQCKNEIGHPRQDLLNIDKQWALMGLFTFLSLNPVKGATAIVHSLNVGAFTNDVS